MLRRKMYGFVVILSLVLFPLSQLAVTRLEAAEKKLKVAFLYLGVVGDSGYNLAHDMGRRHLVKMVPEVETAYTENVARGDTERVLRTYIRRGYKLIFGNTFDYQDGMIRVGKRFKDVVFMHASGWKSSKNVAPYWGREYQARYLTGLVAGRMTRTNRIGYVAAHPYPTVLRGINGFMLGVRKANPQATVRVVFTQAWYDPAKSREAADSLFDVGVDVITQHQDSPAPVQAAERRGKYAIGYNWDMTRFAPKGHLTAAIFNWGVIVEAMTKAVLNGTWKSEPIFWGLEKGAVDIAPLNPIVPKEVKELVDKERKRLASPDFDVFHGPLKDQKGKIRVPAGTRAQGKALATMSYLLEGIQGTLP